MDKDLIIKNIINYVKNEGGKFYYWHIRISDNPINSLIKNDRVDLNLIKYKVYHSENNEDALFIEHHFSKQGMLISSRNKDSDGDYIYIFLKKIKENSIQLNKIEKESFKLIRSIETYEMLMAHLNEDKNSLSKVIFDLINSVDIDNRILILSFNSIIEVLVNKIIEYSCINSKIILSDSRGYPYGVKILILCEMKIISESIYTILHWFKNIRNDAAHKVIFNIDWNKIKSNKYQIIKKVDSIKELCIIIFSFFWFSAEKYLKDDLINGNLKIAL